MTQRVIPLLNGAVNAHQEFTVTLGGNVLDFKCNYTTPIIAGTITPSWILDISQDDVRLASGLALEPNAVLLESYSSLSIGTFVFVGEETTLDNLGTDNFLVWISDDD
jgi:hypothetical protein